MARRSSNRTLPCAGCGKTVHIASRERFLRLVRENEIVCCEQCSGYISTGIARELEVNEQLTVYDLGLRAKCGRGAKNRTALASRKLSRCVVSGL